MLRALAALKLRASSYTHTHTNPTGIIYVSDTELGWEPALKSWLAKREQPLVPGLQACFDKYVSRMLEHVRLNLHPVMYNEAMCTVNSLLTLLAATLRK
jgi:dynein heavy chain